MSIPDWATTLAVLVMVGLNFYRATRRLRICNILSSRSEVLSKKDYDLMVRAYEARGKWWRELRMFFEFLWPAILIAPFIPYSNGFVKALWMIQLLVMSVSYVLLWSSVRQQWGQDHIRYLRHLKWRKQQDFPVFRAP